MATGTIKMFGNIVSSEPSNVSVANATSVKLAQISLGVGTWMVMAYHQFSTSGTDVYTDSLLQNDIAENRNAERFSRVNGGGNQMMRLFTYTEPGTAVYYTYQSSGSTLTANRIYLKAIKLG